MKHQGTAFFFASSAFAPLPKTSLGLRRFFPPLLRLLLLQDFRMSRSSKSVGICKFRDKKGKWTDIALLPIPRMELSYVMCTTIGIQSSSARSRISGPCPTHLDEGSHQNSNRRQCILQRPWQYRHCVWYLGRARFTTILSYSFSLLQSCQFSYNPPTVSSIFSLGDSCFA